MKGTKWHIWNLFMVWLMILCFGIALVSMDKLNNRQNIYMLYQKGEPLTGSAAMELQEQEQEAGGELNFTVWGVKKGLSVKNASLEKEAQAGGILIAGSSDLLLDADVRLDSSDEDGCLVSEDLAYQLFGTKDAARRSILIDEKEYIVRGTLYDAENTVLYPCSAETEAVMDAAAVAVQKDSYRHIVLNTFNQRHGDWEESVSLSIFSLLGRLTVILLPLLMGFLIFIPLIRSSIRQKRQPVMLAAAAGGTLVLFLLYLFVARIRIDLPLDLIPGSWSDFDAWKNTLDLQKGQFWSLLLAEQREPERVFVEVFLQTAKYSLFTLFFFIFFIRKIRFKNLKELYIYSFVAMVSAFFSVWYQRQEGQFLVWNRCFWFLLIFYFVTVFIYDRKHYIKNWIKTNR